MTINLDLKKILIITVAVLIFVVASFFTYNFFFKKPTETPATGQPIIEAPLPPQQTETPFTPISKKLTVISQVPVISPIISADGKKIKYYTRDNGNVFESGFNGAGLTRISNTVLPDILKILWSPDKNKVISIFKDAQTGVRKYYYNYQTGASKPLHKSVQFVSWKPNSEKIVYQFIDENSNSNYLNIAEPDGSNWKNIFPTRLKDLIIEWPKNDLVSFRSKPSGLSPTIFFSLNPDSGKLTNLLPNFYGLSVLWSPNGEKNIYSKTDENGTNLRLEMSEKEGSETKNVGISTFAEKCVWSEDNRTIFCAVPAVLPSNAVLPDDYYKNILNISDDFWQLNLDTGEKTKIDLGEDKSIDASDLLLSPQEDYLFFVNKKDGLLYSLRM